MRTRARATSAPAMGVAAAGTIKLPAAAAELGSQIVDPFVGVIRVFAPEHAVSGPYLDLPDSTCPWAIDMADHRPRRRAS